MTSPHSFRQSRLYWAFGCVLLGIVIHAANLQTLLRMESTATSLMSPSLWLTSVSALGGKLVSADGQMEAVVEFHTLLLLNVCTASVCWFGGAAWISYRSGRTWRQSLADWGLFGWLWWLLPGVWEILNILRVLLPSKTLEEFLLATPQVWVSLMWAGWLATFFALSRREQPVSEKQLSVSDTWRVPTAVWIAVGIYVVVFTVMNWQLYRGLLIPHGDSAMYEEHLWNVTHGKGFRSYLDQGLFLGEHPQIVHLLLIPLHWCWSSHMLLELCESLALASGAIPVFWMARRHSDSSKSATLLACAYLLYVPLQFLDIAIDLKTFRPISFGVPLFLFALDQMERRRLGTMTVLLLIALSAKEDYGIIIAALGVWIALFLSRVPVAARQREIEKQGKSRGGDGLKLPWYRRRETLVGCTMAVLAVVYVVAVITVIVPYFRGGADPHYTRYFGEQDNTPGDIVETALRFPLVVLGKIFSIRSSIYLLVLLMPLGFVPLFSLTRLAVGLPLFSVLCLMQLSPDAPKAALIPFHHFHAPLIPIVFWAAAAGLGNVDAFAQRVLGKSKSTANQRVFGSFAAHFVWTSSLAIGFFLSLSPVGLRFWDRGNSFHYKRLYIVGKRATLFRKVFEMIPTHARVASTDHIHTRFTHHERSYDYSEQRRKVSNYEDKVPDDTDYIVIDTQHQYSKIKRPEQMRELREQPDQWEVLPDDTEGYFIVLKRKSN